VPRVSLRALPTRWAAALLLVVVVGPLVQIATAQPLVRFAQTGALVEERSLVLDAYADTLLVDQVDHDGHVYSDKAPAEAFLAVPVYAVGRALGMESAAVARPEGNLGLWWVTLWMSTLPAAGLLVLMAGAARRVAAAGADLAAMALSFGTLLLPFAGELYGHVLCTLLAYGAWRLVDERRRSTAATLAAGALAGAGVATEYPMALVAGILAVAVVVLSGWRALAWFLAGGAPFAVFVGWYHWAAFGDPLTDPYRLKPAHEGASAAVTGVPRPGQAVEVLLGSRGLLLFAPIVVVGLVGLVRLALRPGRARAGAVVGLATFVALWLLQSGWSNPWGGEMPGPRYMIAALPFLAPGVAEVAVRSRTVVRVALAWGVAAMALPLLTVHLVLGDGTTVLAHVDNVRRWGFSPPVSVVALGPVGWALYGAAVLAAVALLRRSLGPTPSPTSPVRAKAAPVPA
jgi:hypothetical protein